MNRAFIRIAALLACPVFLLAADPFLGNWRANIEKSKLDPNHRAKQASMRFEEDAVGYRLVVSGINGKGEAVSNTILIYLDGKERPAPGEANTVMSASKPDTHTLELIGKKDDRETGRDSYVISEDGAILTATTSGVDGKDRPYKTVMVFEREP